MTKKPETTPNEPQSPTLRLSCLPAKLSPKTAKLVAGYYSACRDYEAGLAELYEHHATLYEQAADLPLSQIKAVGAELRGAMEETATRRVDLAWQRFEILPQLLPDYEAAKVAANKDYEDVVASTTASFAAKGVTAAAMPAGVSGAGEIQLRHRVDHEIEVIAAKHKAAEATTASNQIRNSLVAIPSWRSLLVVWPERSGEHADATTITAGFKDRSQHPGHPSVMGYTEVAEELGLANTFLPDRYSEPLMQIVESIGKLASARRVHWSLTDPNRSKAIGALVDRLPQTNAIKEMMDWVREQSPQPQRRTPKYSIKV